ASTLAVSTSRVITISGSGPLARALSNSCCSSLAVNPARCSSWEGAAAGTFSSEADDSGRDGSRREAAGLEGAALPPLPPLPSRRSWSERFRAGCERRRFRRGLERGLGGRAISFAQPAQLPAGSGL